MKPALEFTSDQIRLWNQRLDVPAIGHVLLAEGFNHEPLLRAQLQPKCQPDHGTYKKLSTAPRVTAVPSSASRIPV